MPGVHFTNLLIVVAVAFPAPLSLGFFPRLRLPAIVLGIVIGDALFSSASTVARVPLFLLALVLVRGLPALLYSGLIGRRTAVIAGLLQATSLPFIVAATQIGVSLGVVTKASAAGLIAAGLLSVMIFPATGLTLLRRGRPTVPDEDKAPTPAMPVVTVEDRALCRTRPVAAA